MFDRFLDRIVIPAKTPKIAVSIQLSDLFLKYDDAAKTSSGQTQHDKHFFE
jgi:hypothetical protein